MLYGLEKMSHLTKRSEKSPVGIGEKVNTVGSVHHLSTLSMVHIIGDLMGSRERFHGLLDDDVSYKTSAYLH